MIDEGFTQKEMLVRILDKLEKFEDKFQKINCNLGKTKELIAETNGKVKLHTKIISAIVGIILSMVGWIMYISK